MQLSYTCTQLLCLCRGTALHTSTTKDLNTVPLLIVIALHPYFFSAFLYIVAYKMRSPAPLFPQPVKSCR
jgi:hypothetical protein